MVVHLVQRIGILLCIWLMFRRGDCLLIRVHNGLLWLVLRSWRLLVWVNLHNGCRDRRLLWILTGWSSHWGRHLSCAVGLWNDALIIVLYRATRRVRIIVADVFENFIVSLVSCLENCDRSLKFGGLIITGPSRLFEKIVFFTHLCQGALQVEDLFILLLKFLRDSHLLLKWDSFLAVS